MYNFSEEGDIDVQELGSKSCVTRFIKKMLSIVSTLLLLNYYDDLNVCGQM